MWALLSLIIPAFSALMICRRLESWQNQAANILVSLVVYVVLFVLPVHLVAAVQLLGLFKTFSLVHIAIFDVSVLLGLLIWNYFNPAVTGLGFGKFSLISYIKTLPKPVIISFAIVSACYFAFALNLFTSYPLGPDGIYYRLPLAVRWLQNGSLSIPPNTWRYALPGNAEIPMMVLLGTGWHASALVFNLIGTIILACSTYLIALKCNVSKAAAFLATLILISFPLINFQSFLAYTEVFGSSFILAAMAFFLYRQDHDPAKVPNRRRFLASLILSGLAFGLAIGTKVAFVVYGAAFLAVVFFVLARERNKHGESLKLLAPILVIAMLAPCIFWFGRAFFTTGNPLYPMKVELFGRTIFDGYSIEFMRPKSQSLDFVQSRIEWLTYPWTETNNRQANYSERGGFGASFAAIVPLGVLYTIFSLFRNRAPQKNTFIFILLSFLAVGLIAFFLVFDQVPRYCIPVMAFACILAAPLIDVFLRYKAQFFGILVISSFATTSLILALTPARSLLGRIIRGEWTRAEIYNYPQIFDDLPHGSTILNLGRLHLNNFALSGKHLSNKVIPFFEQPLHRSKEGFLLAHISEGFLRQNKVDYISQQKNDYFDYIVAQQKGEVLTIKADELDDKNPYPKDLDADIPLKLVYNEADQRPDLDNPWRLWKVLLEPERELSRVEVAF